MENQSTINSSENGTANMAPIKQTIGTTAQPKTNLILPILLTLTTSGIIFGLFGYYLGKQSQNQQTMNYQQSLPTPLPSPATSRATVPPKDQTSPVDNNWRVYTGKTFSFQYPNSWSDAVETTLSTRTEVVSEGNLVISDGLYYDQNLGRAKTYQEYISQAISKTAIQQPYNLGVLKGVRYTDKDNAGRTVVNIILSDAPTSTRIFSIIYLSPVSDVNTINSLLDPVLATFKFAK